MEARHTASRCSLKSDDYLGFRTGHELTASLVSYRQSQAYQLQHDRYMRTKPGSEEAKVELKKLRAMKTC